MHISDLLTQRFGLYCDVLLEQQIKTFDSLVRICAVVVRFNQLPLLLKTLFEQSSYSFAIIAGTQEPSYFWSQLIDSFENGLLTPKAIKACANKALINNASFLHILRGNDGYSINYFSKKWIIHIMIVRLQELLHTSHGIFGSHGCTFKEQEEMCHKLGRKTVAAWVGTLYN